VMEQVSGLPITQFANERCTTTRERLQLFLQLCEAVSYAHSQLLVHRDLKPANVLVSEAGAVKLLDFGISKLMDVSGAEPLTATQDGRAFTPAYSSPEQVQGQYVSTATDVFSLGTLLYEMLTAINPFRREGRNTQSSNLAIMQAVTAFEPKPPSQWMKNLDRDLDAMLLTALAKNPAERYRTVDAFAQDVRRYLDGYPILARAPSTLHLARKFIARNKVGSSLAALAALSMAVGVTTTVIQRNRAEAKNLQLLTQSQRIVFEYHEGALNLPGSLALRKKMMADAAQQLDTMVADAGDDPELLATLASSYQKLGVALFSHTMLASSGDRAAGDAARARGLALAERALARKPAHLDANRVWAGITSDKALTLGNEGKTAEALALFDAAEARLVTALEAQPSANHALYDWVYNRQRAANVAITGGQSGQRQIDVAKTALARWERADPPRTLRDATHLKGLLLGAEQREATRLKDTPRAIALITEQLRIQKAYSETTPDDTTSQQQTASSYAALGTAQLLDAKDYAAALGSLRASLAMYEREFARDKADMRLLSQIARMRLHTGNALMGLNQPDEALVLFAQSVAAWEQSLVTDPRPHLKRQAAESLWRLATVQQSRGLLREAKLTAEKLQTFAAREESTFAKPPASAWLAEARALLK
jgi:eukaryotic-like serine/threonine-protein kinase